MAAGFAAIAGLLLLHALALYLIWWLVMIVVSYVPIIGRKHRHQDWERLNREGAMSVPHRTAGELADTAGQSD